MMRRLTVVVARRALAATSRPTVASFRVSGGLHAPLSCTYMTGRSFSSSGSAVLQVPVQDTSKKQEVIDLEASLTRQLDGHSPHSITGNELISLVRELPVIVSHMTSAEDPISRDIISRTVQLLKEYPKNFEVHLTATFEVITDIDTTSPELRELVSAVAQKVIKLNRPFSDAESWTAINSLRHLSSTHSETLALVRAIASKLPVQNTKIEFTPVDDVLIALRGLNGLDSDCLEVQELMLAINFRLRFKKGKVKFFSSFQDAVLGMHNKSSARPEVKELLSHLVDIKYRWDSFLPPVLAANEDEEESDEDVVSKRTPSRFRLERLDFADGQEVVDFIRVLGKKPHRYSQFHALYKKSDSDRESPYLEVISYLDLPVHTPQFLKENSNYITAHHEAGHIVASHLLAHSPAEAVGAKIRRYVSYTTFRPKDITAMHNRQEGFLDKQATALGGLAAEYLVLGAISASAGNHDFRSVIDSAKEQLTSDGVFLPKEGSSMQLFLKNVQSLVWVVSGSLDRGGEKDWVEEHVLQLLEEQFFRVLELLAGHEDQLRGLAELLLANKSLSEEEIRSILFADKE